MNQDGGWEQRAVEPLPRFGAPRPTAPRGWRSRCPPAGVALPLPGTTAVVHPATCQSPFHLPAPSTPRLPSRQTPHVILAASPPPRRLSSFCFCCSIKTERAFLSSLLHIDSMATTLRRPFAITSALKQIPRHFSKPSAAPLRAFHNSSPLPRPSTSPASPLSAARNAFQNTFRRTYIQQTVPGYSAGAGGNLTQRLLYGAGIFGGTLVRLLRHLC